MRLENLQNLTTLSLRENKIKELPSAIGMSYRHTCCHGHHHPPLGALTQLLLLDVSHNHLESIPEEIGHCVNLTTLDVQHNNLTKIPASTGNLTQLKRFGLRYHMLL